MARDLRRFRKIYSGTSCTVVFVYCCSDHEYSDMTPQWNVCTMYDACIIESATCHTFSTLRNIRASDKSKRTKNITIGSTWILLFPHVHNFYVMVTMMCLLETEWFVQRHSAAWMIHSGPFWWLNDSFRTIQLHEWFIQPTQQNWTFPQQVACHWITWIHKFSKSYSSSKWLSLGKLFRGIHLLEWFFQDHSPAWMIHSGPFRSMNDWFRDMFRNVISITLRTCTGGEMLMTHKTMSETTWNDPISWKLPLRLSSMVAPETSQIMGKRWDIESANPYKLLPVVQNSSRRE